MSEFALGVPYIGSFLSGKFTLSLAYSADGKYLASGAIDGIIAVFDMEQRKLLHTLEVSLEALFCSNLISTCIEPGACHAYQILGLQSR